MSNAQSQEKVRPRARASVRWVAIFCFLLLYIPLISMVVYSFLAPSNGPGSPLEFSLQWYRKVFENGPLIDSLFLSLGIAVANTLGATLLGTMAALSFERAHFRGKELFKGITVIPLVMPELVLGISLLIWFVILRLTLGAFSIILAHITFSISFVIITVQTRLKDFDHAVEEAAKDLGATPWQCFWRVTFPLIWPGILSGAMMAFTLSFDDFLISFFTTGVNSDPLPLKIYSMVKFGISPEINAISTIVLAITFVLVFSLYRPEVTKKTFG